MVKEEETEAIMKDIGNGQIDSHLELKLLLEIYDTLIKCLNELKRIK